MNTIAFEKVLMFSKGLQRDQTQLDKHGSPLDWPLSQRLDPN